jgi:RNA polymerase sigma factor (sigma-70 family)
MTAARTHHWTRRRGETQAAPRRITDAACVHRRPAQPSIMDSEAVDRACMAKVRAGSLGAYGTLYRRHLQQSHKLARRLARTPAEADDLVSEAFANVLSVLRRGGGPDSAFRAYLLTAVRHAAYDKARRERRVHLSGDIETAGGAAFAAPFLDTAVAGLERTLAAQAFGRLPQRWQAVLWYTEIEGRRPADLAPVLGLTPNGVSALAYRAREGLRQAYLQAHLSGIAEHCGVTEQLGAWTRGGLSRRMAEQVEIHLAGCGRCHTFAAELAVTNDELRCA